MDALAVQVKLDVGNAIQTSKEMAVPLLNLDISDVDTTRTIKLFVEAVLSKLRLLLPDQPLDQVTECLLAVRKHQPGLHMVRLALFHCISCRREMTFVDDDRKVAVSVLEGVLASSPPRVHRRRTRGRSSRVHGRFRYL
jgi:hypothetical protein